MTRYHHTTINLHAADVKYMQQAFGRGWTNHVRDIVHQGLKAIHDRSDYLDKYITAVGNSPNEILDDMPFIEVPPNAK